MTLSARLLASVGALPLRPGMRVLEIGGAPGAAAREVVRRTSPGGYVLVVDRSPRGIALTRGSCAAEIEEGLLQVRESAVEDVGLEPSEAPPPIRSRPIVVTCRIIPVSSRAANRACSIARVKRLPPISTPSIRNNVPP